MQELKKEDTAPFVLIYGDTNVGKTTSILRTVPQPIYCISTEMDAFKSVEVIENEGEKIKIKIVVPESQEDLLDNLNTILKALSEGKKPFVTIVFDSASFYMNCKLQGRLEDDRFNDKGFKHGAKMSLVKYTHTTFDEVGSANSQMRRLTALFQQISKLGVGVYFTAQMSENPKWNRELSAAPGFNFKEYNLALKSYFDYIGFLTNRFNEEGDIVYPPLISFRSEDGSFMAKWRGVQLKNPTGVCDFGKIFKKK